MGLDDLDPSIWTKRYDALNAVLSAVEQQGALVRHTTNVAVEEVSGFSLAEMPFPVIGLNGSDWPSRRLYTLLHECVHLALRDGGACDLHEVAGVARGTDATERWCNRVAASALMPEARVRELLQRQGRAFWSPDIEGRRTFGHSFGTASMASWSGLVAFCCPKRSTSRRRRRTSRHGHGASPGVLRSWCPRVRTSFGRWRGSCGCTPAGWPADATRKAEGWSFPSV